MLPETKSRFNQKKRALYELPLVPEVFEENEMSLVNQYVKDKYYCYSSTSIFPWRTDQLEFALDSTKKWFTLNSNHIEAAWSHHMFFQYNLCRPCRKLRGREFFFSFRKRIYHWFRGSSNVEGSVKEIKRYS